MGKVKLYSSYQVKGDAMDGQVNHPWYAVERAHC